MLHHKTVELDTQATLSAQGRKSLRAAATVICRGSSAGDTRSHTRPTLGIRNAARITRYAPWVAHTRAAVQARTASRKQNPCDRLLTHSLVMSGPMTEAIVQDPPRPLTQVLSGARRLSSWSTTPGSARVEVSPSESSSRAAIFRSTRRMILPERVFGIAANIMYQHVRGSDAETCSCSAESAHLCETWHHQDAMQVRNK